jgi:hypothetical protein
MFHSIFLAMDLEQRVLAQRIPVAVIFDPDTISDAFARVEFADPTRRITPSTDIFQPFFIAFRECAP